MKSNDFQKKRIKHWNTIAERPDHWKVASKFYHERLITVHRHLIPPNKKVLEIGCAKGDLLAAVQPSLGVGIDFSDKMISKARSKYPNLHFVLADAHTTVLKTTFDYIILSDLISDIFDIQLLLSVVNQYSDTSTRIICNGYSKLWELPLRCAQRLNLSNAHLPQNWTTIKDNENLLNLTNFQIIRTWQEVVCPLPIPFLESLFNKILVRFWPFKHFALTNFIVARKDTVVNYNTEKPSITLIIPARNESGNIMSLLQRVPEFGCKVELLFVEGNSTDDTFQEIGRCIKQFPEKKSILIKQTGKGKGDAVRLGCEQATGDILFILDADMTVAPEDLPRFYESIVTNKGEFINGVRLVYPREKKSMRFMNLIGNKFFSIFFSWLIGQHVKDTLCGTKVFWKKDYQTIKEVYKAFGKFDPFGDFDLLIGAAECNLKIIDIPIRYNDRTYGTTNIHRWRQGFQLLKMVLIASKRIKFS